MRMEPGRINKNQEQVLQLTYNNGVAIVPNTAGRTEDKCQIISWITINDTENLRNCLVLLQHILDWLVQESLLPGETPHTGFVDVLHACWPLLWHILS